MANNPPYITSRAIADYLAKIVKTVTRLEFDTEFKRDIRWHRIAESKPYSFSINGFITHFPDFLVATSKGTFVIVEVKGDDRDNSDSERKLRLGRKWTEKAGDDFRYYMVFDKLNWSKEGAYDLSEFVGLMGRL